METDVVGNMAERGLGNMAERGLGRGVRRGSMVDGRWSARCALRNAK